MAYFDIDTGSTATVIATSATNAKVRYVANVVKTTNCTPRFSVDLWLIAEQRQKRRQASLEGQRPLERIDGEPQYEPPAWRRCMQPPGRFPFYQGAF
jgi:hypothetical protein